MPHVHLADTFNMEVVAEAVFPAVEKRLWRSLYLPNHPTGPEIEAAMYSCPWLEEPLPHRVRFALHVVHAGESLADVSIVPAFEEGLLQSLADMLWRTAAAYILATYDGNRELAEERHQLFLQHGGGFMRQSDRAGETPLPLVPNGG